MSVEYTELPVTWTVEEAVAAHGAVNAEPVTIGKRTFPPEHLLCTGTNFTPIATGIYTGVATLAFDDDRPGGWNHVYNPAAERFCRIVDDAGQPPYPVLLRNLDNSNFLAGGDPAAVRVIAAGHISAS